MNARIKALWLAELRNENNRQGEGRLRRPPTSTESGLEEFCCLGLLCEIAVRDGVIDPPMLADDGQHDQFYQYCGDGTQLLPSEVWRWAELLDCNPIVVHSNVEDVGSMQSGLSELNDDGWSFERIAQLIESQL